MNPPVKMLVIYVDESDIWGDAQAPLYEAIVRRLRQLSIAGATVQFGVMGFGSHQKVHHKRLFGISDDKPVIITTVDNEDKLRKILPEIRGMVREGLIVLLDVEFIAQIMQALEVWKAVTMDRSNFLDHLIALLSEHNIRYCVIGGQGVNAYVEPLVSLDLDLFVAVSQLELAKSLLGRHFRLERFANRLNISAAGSNLRVQIQTDSRYFEFPDRAAVRDVLGLPMPVARKEDILQGKIWAATDPQRRPSKRRKDLLDIERLLETFPELSAGVPAEIRDWLSRI